MPATCRTTPGVHRCKSILSRVSTIPPVLAGSDPTATHLVGVGHATPWSAPAPGMDSTGPRTPLMTATMNALLAPPTPRQLEASQSNGPGFGYDQGRCRG